MSARPRAASGLVLIEFRCAAGGRSDDPKHLGRGGAHIHRTVRRRSRVFDAVALVHNEAFVPKGEFDRARQHKEHLVPASMRIWLIAGRASNVEITGINFEFMYRTARQEHLATPLGDWQRWPL